MCVRGFDVFELNSIKEWEAVRAWYEESNVSLRLSW